MKNILTIYCTVLPEEDEYAQRSLELSEGRIFNIEGTSTILGTDTGNDFLDELIDCTDDFLADLRAYFREEGNTEVNWKHWEHTQQLHVLFEENWSTDYTEGGIEQDVVFEYFGILDLDHIPTDICFRNPNAWECPKCRSVFADDGIPHPHGIICPECKKHGGLVGVLHRIHIDSLEDNEISENHL